jgi:PPOX class probable F420-dependent enzyme
MAGPPPHLAPLLRERRGYLATMGPDGYPHLIPICFTWAGDVIWTAVDAKPKRDGKVQRVKDIEAKSQVAFTVDRWNEDWSRLAWLQARGRATVLSEGPESKKATSALKSKYPQYNGTRLTGPVIRIDVERWIGWPATA